MGITDYMNGDDNEEDSNEKEKAKYERLEKTDMVKFLNRLERDHDISWSYADMKGQDSQYRGFDYELVYEIELPAPNLSIYLFSSISARTGKARDKGSDAIRTVIWDHKANRPIGGKKRTNRIKTWEKNLKKKVLALIDEWRTVVVGCSVCDGWMIEKEGEYGKFRGCTNYPECHNTENIED